MSLYPVIMCGGAGTRLWPASRPSRPKQFIALYGDRSLFQETALRVAPLADHGGRLIVVAGVAHRDHILEQLAELGLEAQILLEPEARDSAPAMTAAAAWSVRVDPQAVNVFVASDHHIPDHQAFCGAVRDAAEAAREGRVVTLGVVPRSAATAYGYIAPAGAGLAPVRAFVEKPGAETAARYIAEGYLWNSGNFIVSAATLLDEVERAAPQVAAAARASLPPADAGALAVLSAAFSAAPRVSIDYAVMESTDRASVLPVDFEWSDLGAWDAVAETGTAERGTVVLEDAEGCMVRASEGQVVAVLGVRNLAVIVEQDAVLVCDLSRAQEVKKVVERVGKLSSRHLDFPAADEVGLVEGGERLSGWLRLRAFPVWSTVGQSEDGAFAELVSSQGLPLNPRRRARVQARQIFVFAEAGRQGWAGPWRRAVRSGLDYLEAGYMRPDGLMRTLLDEVGAPLDETAMLYDQAFHMLARAAVRQAGLAGDHEAWATRARDALLAQAPSTGGLIEQGAHPYQSNAHMHLLEACLAWEEAGGDGAWAGLADRIVELARSRFIDGAGGFLREFFNADWTPADGDDGRLVEPGHQFEWAWLLARYGQARGDASATEAARRLHRFGRRGIDVRLGAALDALDDHGTPRARRSRLWPQTEWVKSALILATLSEGDERAALMDEAASAQRAVQRYLTDDGLWRDTLLETGDFVDEPAPASSLYHIMGAHLQYLAAAPLLT